MDRQELAVPGTWPDAEKVVIASTEFDDGKMVVEVVEAKGKEEALVHELPVEPEEVQTPDSPVRRHYEDRKGAWKDLPIEILQRILYLSDPETFASLSLVNQSWRAASAISELYAYQLSRCPSFSISHGVVTGPYTEESLPELRTKFVQEVKRNLFTSYLQPKQTTVSLISTTMTSSSAAFPVGEAFNFTFSPNGMWCLALSSSRIFVLDTSADTIQVDRELKVRRRPISAAILDDGHKIAVLSTDHQVNVYNMSQRPPAHLQSVSLDNPPDVIALSPKGEVLAAAFDGGVEVHSLLDSSIAQASRAVKCDRVDSLSFSADGTMLLGTTQAHREANTVILSAPYFTEADQDMDHGEMISHMWTSQILFPNSSRDCSHSALLPARHESEGSWTMTYDRVFESFRAVRTDDLRNGTTYFTGPKPARTKSRARPRRKSKTKLLPCTLPTISQKGELVAAGFSGSEIWLYGIPSELDISQNGTPSTGGNEDRNQAGSSTEPSSTSGVATELAPLTTVTRGETNELETPAPWQALVDKNRNVFTQGRRVAKIPGVTQMTWLSRKQEPTEPERIRERLIVAAPGGVSGFSELEEEEHASVDGGRLVILDFDRTVQMGGHEETLIEVGNVAPELLEEKSVDMDTEIAIVRRRTVAQRNQGNSRVSVIDALRPLPGDVPEIPPLPAQTSVGFGLDHTIPAAPATQTHPGTEPASPTEGLTLAEVSEALDGPYSHTDPRSRNTLYRSATAVAANRERNPQPRIPDSGRVEFRRTDGTELPHESDADNWVPPPPPYSPDADRPLPEHLRATLVGRAPLPLVSGPRPRGPLRSQTTREAAQDAAIRRRSSADVDHLVDSMRRPQAHQQFSDDPSLSGRQAGIEAGDNQPPPRERSRNPLANLLPLRRPQTIVERRSSTFHPQPRQPTAEQAPPVPAIPPIPQMPIVQNSTPTTTPHTSTVLERRLSLLRGRPVPNPEPIPPIPHLPSQSPRPSNTFPLVSPLPFHPSRSHHSPSGSVSLPSSASESAFPTNAALSPPPHLPPHLTLSGSNLQQRLDYPLPPRPPVTPGISPEQSPHLAPIGDGGPPSPQELTPLPQNTLRDPLGDYLPPSPPLDLTLTQPHPSTHHPPSPNEVSEASDSLPPIPSAYQLNNLQNRCTPSPHPPRSSSSLSTTHSTQPPTTRPTYHPFHLPKSRAPRAALGAASGVAPTPPDPQHPRSASAFAVRPRVEIPVTRSTSRHEERSAPLERPSTSHSFLWRSSASTPDLMSRPGARRLDTITSIASAVHDEDEILSPISGTESRLGVGGRESRLGGRESRIGGKRESRIMHGLMGGRRESRIFSPDGLPLAQGRGLGRGGSMRRARSEGPLGGEGSGIGSGGGERTWLGRRKESKAGKGAVAAAQRRRRTREEIEWGGVDMGNSVRVDGGRREEEGEGGGRRCAVM